MQHTVICNFKKVIKVLVERPVFRLPEQSVDKWMSQTSGTRSRVLSLVASCNRATPRGSTNNVK